MNKKIFQYIALTYIIFLLLLNCRNAFAAKQHETFRFAAGKKRGGESHGLKIIAARVGLTDIVALGG